jgi:hypothetical protein
MKKTGPIHKGLLRWKDRVAILKKLGVLFAKTRGYAEGNRSDP